MNFLYAVFKHPVDSSGKLDSSQESLVDEVFKCIYDSSDRIKVLGLNFETEKNKFLFNLDKSAESTYSEVGSLREYRSSRVYGNFGSSLYNDDIRILENELRSSSNSSCSPVVVIIRQDIGRRVFFQIDDRSEVSGKIARMISELQPKR